MPSLHSASAPNRDLLFGQLNFEVKISTLDVLVGFFTQVQGLSAQLDVLEYPEGGRNDMVHKLPSRIKQGNLTLKVGLTHQGALLSWFEAAIVQSQSTDMSLTLLDTLNNPQRSWSFAQAYPVKWSASDLHAGGTEIMTETLEVAHQGMKAVPVSGGAA